MHLRSEEAKESVAEEPPQALAVFPRLPPLITSSPLNGKRGAFRVFDKRTPVKQLKEYW